MSCTPESRRPAQTMRRLWPCGYWRLVILFLLLAATRRAESLLHLAEIPRTVALCSDPRIGSAVRRPQSGDRGNRRAGGAFLGVFSKSASRRPDKNKQASALAGTILKGQRRDDDNDDPPFSLIDVVDRVGGALAQPLPVPGLQPVALGFVLVLLIQAVVAGWVPALVSAALFGTLRTLSRSLILFEETIDEDVYGIAAETETTAGQDDNPKKDEEDALAFQIDAVTLVLSVFVAQVLVPDDLSSKGTVVTAVPVLALLALVATLLANAVQQVEREEQLTKDDKILNRWDEKYNMQQKEQQQQSKIENHRENDG